MHSSTVLGLTLGCRLMWVQRSAPRSTTRSIVSASSSTVAGKHSAVQSRPRSARRLVVCRAVSRSSNSTSAPSKPAAAIRSTFSSSVASPLPAPSCSIPHIDWKTRSLMGAGDEPQATFPVNCAQPRVVCWWRRSLGPTIS
jgi:hypothetical protein